MIKNHCYEFASYGRAEVPGTFLLPREVALAWFCRVVISQGLVPNLPPVCRRVLL